MPGTRDGSGAGDVDVDAVVVGAGIAGLWMLHELRGLGLSTRVFETGADVGGTWFWNRYPGARTDSEASYYLYFFPEPKRGEDWAWRDRYPAQAECLAYLRHVTDSLDLRRDIQFDTRVTAAEYDEAGNRWTVTTDRGDVVSCRYLITATGVLSEPYAPAFPGVDSFEGEWYIPARWPHEEVVFEGKRVGVIGTGASAVQAIPLIAQSADHLRVFQRTANFVLPARNYPWEDAHRHAAARQYDSTYTKAHGHFFGMPFESADRAVSEVSPQERDRILEAAWEEGGFRFLFQAFSDTLVDRDSNEAVCEFIRNKIRAIVKDPRTAEMLLPRGVPLAAKRPPLGQSYYETFNRDNVTLVDVGTDPIVEITPTGLRTENESYDLDMIICATGFDAATGPLLRMDIRGRGGQRLQEVWREAAKAYLGLAVDGFPNMFMICGPGTPFANIPTIIEKNVRWISRALVHLRERGHELMEATPEATASWGELLEQAINATVLIDGKDAHSWFVGANIPGKPRYPLFHFGGTAVYGGQLDQVAADDFAGFVTRAPAVQVSGG